MKGKNYKMIWRWIVKTMRLIEMWGRMETPSVVRGLMVHDIDIKNDEI